MERKKKHEKTLKLIALFQEREVLWNINCFSYRRNDLKKKALEEIAAECNITAELAKKRIKALRSTYVLEKKKVDQSKKSGCDATNVYESSLFWYKEMTFLDSSIVARKPVNNIERCNSYESINLDESFQSPSIEPALDYTPFSSKRKSEREDDKFDEALEKLVNLTEKNNDVYSAFADCIVMQLRAMPEKVDYKTMTDIQNLVYKRKFEDEHPSLIFKSQKKVASSPESQNSVLSNTCDSDILYMAMSEADIHTYICAETDSDAL